jgi:hypothetical protein
LMEEGGRGWGGTRRIEKQREAVNEDMPLEGGRRGRIQCVR